MRCRRMAAELVDGLLEAIPMQLGAERSYIEFIDSSLSDGVPATGAGLDIHGQKLLGPSLTPGWVRARLTARGRD